MVKSTFLPGAVISTFLAPAFKCLEALSLLRKASENELKGILKYTEEELVSTDYRGENHSAVVDGVLTMTMGEKMAKIIAWYDNEWGYSMRVVDAVIYIGGLK
jgi:glyceraldehyde 3-phosphate dehydrogenase